MARSAPSSPGVGDTAGAARGGVPRAKISRGVAFSSDANQGTGRLRGNRRVWDREAAARELREIVEGLSARIGELVRDLLPGGRVDGQWWVCGDVTGQAGKSLTVKLAGERRGWWLDYAGEGRWFDALELLTQSPYVGAGDKVKAIKWAKAFLGLDNGDPAALERTRAAVAAHHQNQASGPTDKQRREKYQRLAARIYLSGSPIENTPAADYLRVRAIDFPALGRPWPNALRFVPDLLCRERGQDVRLPGLVMAMRSVNGKGLQAIQRIYLEQRGGQWVKADLKSPKLTLGPAAGAFVPLARGASGKSMTCRANGVVKITMPADDLVVVLEGPEDALSFALAYPEARVLCTCGIGGLDIPDLPPCNLVWAIQNDAVPSLRQRLQRQVASVRARRSLALQAPPPGFKDWNDLARAIASGEV